MRITLINQFYIPDISPTAHLTASLAEGLADAGHEVTVVTSQGGYVSRAGERGPAFGQPAHLPSVDASTGQKSIWKRCADYGIFYTLAAVRTVSLPAQDVIISLTTPPYIAWVGVFHKMLHRRTKFILWNMDCYPDVVERAGLLKTNGLLMRFMRAMNRALFRRLDHLICLDPAMQNLLMGQYAPRRSPTRRALPVSIIPNWERASLFPADVGGVQRWDEATALGLDNQFVVLYLGNTGVGHPFEAVIEACKRLRGQNVKFVFVGGGKRWQWLKDAKIREGLDNLVLHEYVPKELSGSVMAAADCALITLDEKMAGIMSPSKLHANLAMALPVIYLGPESSNVDEAIKQFECGVSLRGGDVEGIVTFIQKAIAEPERFGRLKRAARYAFDAAYCDTQSLPRFQRVVAAVTGERAAEQEAIPGARQP